MNKMQQWVWQVVSAFCPQEKKKTLSHQFALVTLSNKQSVCAISLVYLIAPFPLPHPEIIGSVYMSSYN